MTGCSGDDRVRGEQLFAAALLGESRAQDEFLAWLRPWVISYAKAKMFSGLKRWVDPEDVVQEVLVKSLEDLSHQSPDARIDDFMPSVWRTANRRIYDEQRKHRLKEGGSVVPEWFETLAAERGSSGAVTQEDDRRWLRRLISELPVAYGEVVRLIALEGLDVFSAAQHLGLPPATVRKRYERARQALQRRGPGRENGA